MMFVKRVYDRAEAADGALFLVDHLWPRRMKKAGLRMDGRVKTVSPSDGLRNWFGHDPEKWDEFQTRYFAELNKKTEACLPLLEAARKGHLTLLFSAHDTEQRGRVENVFDQGPQEEGRNAMVHTDVHLTLRTTSTRAAATCFATACRVCWRRVPPSCA